MIIKTDKITLKTLDKVPDFTDLTDQVAAFVEKSGVREGQVLIFSQHTTAGIMIQEYEAGIFEDLQKMFLQIASKEADYVHHLCAKDVPDEPLNGYAHCHHSLIGPSEVVPISDGKMMLGTYQHIYLVELDSSRTRTVVVQVVGL